MTTFRIPSARRYYLAKRYESLDVGDEELAAAWQGKQQAQPGTPLPSTFPGRSDFIAAAYCAVEDFEGADVDELVSNAGVTRRIASAALAACEEL